MTVTGWIWFPLAAGLVVASFATTAVPIDAGQGRAAGGTIVGRVRVTGSTPGNPFIRMGADPICGRLNAGKRLVQEYFAKSPDGGLANVFVHVEGSFPSTPVPADPVMIDQQACVYHPRMIGARVGQTLQIKNSDPLLHNLHGISAKGNDFNVGQPTAGMIFKFPLKGSEVLHVKCDVHSWMNSYVGVVSHPYFAVSGEGGAFRIAQVPAGRQTVQAWHERLGPLTQTVDVKAGATTTVSFMYTGAEKPSAAAGLPIQELIVPIDTTIAALVTR